MSKTVLNFLCTCLLVAYFSTIALAQSPTLPNGIAAKGLFINHIEPFENTFTEFQDNTYGGEIAYLRHLKGPLSLAVPLKVGLADFVNETPALETAQLMMSLDARLHLSYFKDHKILAPYLLAGIGVTYLDVAATDGETFPQIPVGAGLQIKLKNGLYAQLQYEYRFDLVNDYDNDQIGVGLAYYFSGKPKIKDMDGDGIADEMDDCPEQPGTEDLFGCPDTDGDGLADQFDKCPEVIGLPKMGGCPDVDEDGVPDHKDDCPQEAGPKENGGCPYLDSDGDGVPDGVDDCVDVPGVPENYGCPVNEDPDGDGFPNDIDACPDLAGSLNGCPDTDGDGVADPEDSCPNIAGAVSNYGCPDVASTMAENDLLLLEQAKYDIQFADGQSTLTTASEEILDQIAAILTNYSKYNLSIAGHTDSIGSSGENQKLSERRAKACYDYLVSRGVNPSRLSHTGYGESEPIESNKYKAGRAKNRRIEFNAFKR